MSESNSGSRKCECPERVKMGKFACGNPAQCWEPCGQLGKSEQHAVATPVQAVLTHEDLYGGKSALRTE